MTTISLISAIDQILNVYFEQSMTIKVPGHILEDLKLEVRNTIESINIYRSELESER